MATATVQRIATAAGLAVTLALAGCADMGHVATPEHPVDPASLDAGNAIREANADAKWPSEDWWTAFGDAQLDTWVAAAIASNPSLAAAQARVREAQEIVGVARSAMAPQVNGNVSIQRQGWPNNAFYGPGPYADATTWNNTGALSLSYHLDVWGKDKNTTLKALDIAHATAADERAAQLDIEANVVRSYVDLSLHYALLDIANTALDEQKSIADIATRRLRGGLGTQLDVTQAQAPIPEYARRVDDIEESIALDKNRLAALAGKGPGAGDAITRPTLSLGEPQGLPSTLPADLIGHRPDVVAARWTVAAQARDIDVAKADFYPDINLLASIGGYAAGGPLFAFLKPALGQWTAGPAMSLPILNGGRLRSQLGAASAGYDEAAAEYDETIVDALKQISDEVVHLRSLQTQQEDADQSQTLAQKNYDLAKQAYARGLTDDVNVLVAQEQRLRAQEGVATVEAERLEHRASLAAALGGGLDVPADGPTPEHALPAQHIRPFDIGDASRSSH